VGCNVKISLNPFDIFGKSNENHAFASYLAVIFEFLTDSANIIEPCAVLVAGPLYTRQREPLYEAERSLLVCSDLNFID
jgi:hypothetical protein